METSEMYYCRFCAEPKSINKMLTLENNDEKYENIQRILTFINATYVDFSKDKNLPKTVCFVCEFTLNNIYEFLNKVNKSQNVLKSIFLCGNDDLPIDLSSLNNISKISNDCTTKENLIHQGEASQLSLKKETTEEPKENKTFNYTVKIEPGLEDTDKTNVKQNATLTPSILEVTFESQKSKESEPSSLKQERVINTWTEYPWCCIHCNVQYPNIERLRSHSKNSHAQCYGFKCCDCNRLHDNFDFNVFVEHVKVHRPNLRDECYYCNCHTDNLPAHLKSHFEDQPPCPSCGEIIKNKDQQQKHMKFTIKKKKTVRRKPGTPLTEKDLTCKICFKVMKSLSSLCDHRKRHSVDRKKNFTCDYCDKKFYSKGSLTTHIMTHAKIFPHVCKVCNKAYQCAYMLRRHVDVHTNIKPYKCDQCEKGFRLQQQLTLHKQVHIKDLKYSCELCDKKFRYKQALKCHERQHSGLKPYCCIPCGMEFPYWSNYNKHTKNIHGINLSKRKTDVEKPEELDLEEWRSKIMVPNRRGKKAQKNDYETGENSKM